MKRSTYKLTASHRAGRRSNICTPARRWWRGPRPRGWHGPWILARDRRTRRIRPCGSAGVGACSGL